MGSAASDLSSIAPSTLHKEVNAEFAKASALHMETIGSHCVRENAFDEINAEFAKLEEHVRKFNDLFKESEENQKVSRFVVLRCVWFSIGT